MLALKFHCAVTCVAINAKEGDCWIQLINCVLSLMLHKFHISINVISVLVSACRAHSGNEDSFLCLLSIPMVAKFRR